MKMCLLSYKKIYVVYDRNVEQFAQKIAGDNPSFPLDADDRNKTMDTILDICRWLLTVNADRSALVLAVGGGFTTDITGFAASIYKRGLRYANIPTTLLAMVDASIGGKTGVNFDSYKNMIGSFRQPEFTYIYPKVLETLPVREYNSGVAEMLKTFLIKNSDHNYEKAVEQVRKPFDAEAMEPLIEAAAQVKSKIVRKDEFDEGPRMVLNLGHTYGHAIEWWQTKNNVQQPYSHGEAVAIGIIQAAKKSVEKGIAMEYLPGQLSDDFARCGLPTELPCPESELDDAILHDKKQEGGKLNFVFIKEIGKVVVKKI